MSGCQDRKLKFSKSTDPVFIVGTGRSGTTILGRCLNQHRSLLFIDEPRFINHILIPAAENRLDEAAFTHRLTVSDDGTGKEPMKFIRRLKEHYGHLLDQQMLNQIQRETTERCLHFYTELPNLDRIQRLYAIRKIIENLRKNTSDLIGGNRWLIKQPDLSENLDVLTEIFPNSRFIHIIRNPFDVLDSRVQRGFQNSFESALEVWRRRLQAIALFNRSSSNLMTIPFEHLIESPERVLKDIGGFLNLTSGQWIHDANKMVRLDRANIDRGVDQFSQEQKNAVISAWREVDRMGGYWLDLSNANSQSR